MNYNTSQLIQAVANIYAGVQTGKQEAKLQQQRDAQAESARQLDAQRLETERAQLGVLLENAGRAKRQEGYAEDFWNRFRTPVTETGTTFTPSPMVAGPLMAEGMGLPAGLGGLFAPPAAVQTTTANRVRTFADIANDPEMIRLAGLGGLGGMVEKTWNAEETREANKEKARLQAQADEKEAALKGKQKRFADLHKEFIGYQDKLAKNLAPEARQGVVARLDAIQREMIEMAPDAGLPVPEFIASWQVLPDKGIEWAKVDLQTATQKSLEEYRAARLKLQQAELNLKAAKSRKGGSGGGSALAKAKFEFQKEQAAVNTALKLMQMDQRAWASAHGAGAQDIETALRLAVSQVGKANQYGQLTPEQVSQQQNSFFESNLAQLQQARQAQMLKDAAPRGPGGFNLNMSGLGGGGLTWEDVVRMMGGNGGKGDEPTGGSVKDLVPWGEQVITKAEAQKRMGIEVKDYVDLFRSGGVKSRGQIRQELTGRLGGALAAKIMADVNRELNKLPQAAKPPTPKKPTQAGKPKASPAPKGHYKMVGSMRVWVPG